VTPIQRHAITTPWDGGSAPAPQRLTNGSWEVSLVFQLEGDDSGVWRASVRSLEGNAIANWDTQDLRLAYLMLRRLTDGVGSGPFQLCASADNRNLLGCRDASMLEVAYAKDRAA